MPILIECPTCSRRVKVPEEAAGKKVKCPGCEGYMTVPALEPDSLGFEEVSDAAPRRKSSLRLKDDDDDAPRRSPRRRNREDDDDDDRPRRTSRRRDEDDDYPRRNRGMNPQTKKILIFGGGGVTALLLLLGLLWAVGAFGSKKGSGLVKGPPPDGWSKVEDAAFTVFMPGTPTSTMGGIGNRTVNGVQIDQTGILSEGTERQANWRSSLTTSGTTFMVYARTYASKTVGSSEPLLLEEANKIAWTSVNFNDRGRRSEIMNQSMITSAGKPCLEVKYQDADTSGYTRPRRPSPANMNIPPPPVIQGPNAAEMNRRFEEQRRAMEESRKRDEANMDKIHQENADRFLKNRKQGMVRIVSDGKRIYVLIVECTGKEPDADMVKTFFDSFEPS